MVVLVTCKNEEDPLKNDDTRVFTTIIFQKPKGRKFELIQAFMHCLVSCKNEVDQINKEGIRVFTTLFIVFFFRCLRAVNSVVSGRIWLKFQLIQDFMHVLVSCRNEEDQIQTEGTRVLSSFLPLLIYGDFFRRSRAANYAVQGWFWPHFDLIRDRMVFFITCKNEEDPIKH